MLARFGLNLATERRARAMSQEKLAELVDMHPRVIQKIEAGETNVKATTLFRLQSALGCEWERLAPRIS